MSASDYQPRNIKTGNDDQNTDEQVHLKWPAEFAFRPFLHCLLSMLVSQHRTHCRQNQRNINSLSSTKERTAWFQCTNKRTTKSTQWHRSFFI